MKQPKKGPGDKEKKARSKSGDTISPYYATMKYGGPLEKSTAKKTMAGYFQGNAANKRKETEAQHMARQAKKDTIPSARKARGVYQAPAMGSGAHSSIRKKAGGAVKRKR